MLTVRATRSLNPVQYYYNPSGFFLILKVALELSTPEAVGSTQSCGRRTLVVGLSISCNSATINQPEVTTATHDWLRGRFCAHLYETPARQCLEFS